MAVSDFYLYCKVIEEKWQLWELKMSNFSGELQLAVGQYRQLLMFLTQNHYQ
jgi:hypothetical protein